MAAMELIQDLTPAHAKLACYVCERDESPFIDTDSVIVGEGTLAICTGCVRRMAAEAGFDVIEREEEDEPVAPRRGRK